MYQDTDFTPISIPHLHYTCWCKFHTKWKSPQPQLTSQTRWPRMGWYCFFKSIRYRIWYWLFLFDIDIDTNTVTSLRSQRFQFINEIIVLINNSQSTAHDCTLCLLFGDNKKNTGLGDKVWTGHVQYWKHWYYLLVIFLRSSLGITGFEYLVSVLAHPYRWLVCAGIISINTATTKLNL